MNSLPVKNLLHKPGRTVLLLLLTAMLSLSVFGGSIVVRSLQRGLNGLEARLGADIIVLPASAESKVSFQNLLLLGTAGAFYMDASTLDRVLEVDGIETAAPQTFLASLKADCCSIKIQVIGLDPEKDFTVRPWIAQSYSGEMGPMEIVVGSKVEVNVGEMLRIYEQNCKVVASLAPTGTGLDTAVYCTMETMNELLKAAEERGVSHKITSGGDEVVSAIYVKVRPGYSIDQVNSRLNGHVRKVTAVRTRSMITQVSGSLAGVSRIVTLLIAVVWVLSFLILLLVYVLMIRERRREFAVLRMLGASRKKLSGILLTESALCSFAGGCLGIVLAAVMVFPFTTLIEQSLALPYLTPPAGEIAGFMAATLILTILIGALSSALTASKLSRTDPGVTLREGA